MMSLNNLPNDGIYQTETVKTEKNRQIFNLLMVPEHIISDVSLHQSPDISSVTLFPLHICPNCNLSKLLALIRFFTKSKPLNSSAELILLD